MTSQTSSTDIVYRRVTEDDLPSAHGLSEAMHWAHRLEDWQLMHRLGTGFVAEENGAVIGTGLCWKFGNTHGSLGMIIVSPEQQGKGIGRELMSLLLEELGDRCILLTATSAGQPLYEKLGFVPTGTVNQHQGTMQQTLSLALAAGERIRPVEGGDLQALAALALRALGMTGEEVLAQVLSVAEGVLLEKDGETLGFSLMRRFGRGYVIGPVVAPDTGRAKALIAHWAATYAGSFVRVDVAGDSDLSTWVESLGLTLIAPSLRMTRCKVPVPDGVVKQYAVFSQAIG